MLRKRSTFCDKAFPSHRSNSKSIHLHSHPQSSRPSFLFHSNSLLRRWAFALCLGTMIGLPLLWVLTAFNRFPISGSSLLPNDQFDAIIVGSGLAGLTTALTIVDRGGHVVVLEKTATLGGNSIKASSGLNACCHTTVNDAPTDTLDLFAHDTTVSAGSTAKPHLIKILVEESASALAWIEERLDLQMDQVAQLGGHSVARTHRPVQGMVGSALVSRLSQKLRQHPEQCTILTQATVTSLETSDDGIVAGVTFQTENEEGINDTHTIYAPHTILATGGFAADPRWLQRVKPELLAFSTTAGSFSTGDGMTLASSATAADTLDLDLIQLHPTGFVDPAQPTQRSKILAAEVLRGVGGILLTAQGKRVANELGLRSEVTRKILEHDDTSYLATGIWTASRVPPVVTLLLSGSAAQKAKSHVDWYVSRGLLQKIVGLKALADHLDVSENVLEETLKEYRDYARQGVDPFGKTSFPDLFEDSAYFVGTVTPVLHYCMGGLRIDGGGQVLNKEGLPIGGLYAAGEATGGVHGDNRLGGNSLLECTVFGRRVGDAIQVRKPAQRISRKPNKVTPTAPEIFPHKSLALHKISAEELAQHGSKSTCWVALRDRVYDLTNFALQHAGGQDPIHLYCGKDATETFHMIHSQYVMDRLVDLPAVGVWAE